MGHGGFEGVPPSRTFGLKYVKHWEKYGGKYGVLWRWYVPLKARGFPTRFAWQPLDFLLTSYCSEVEEIYAPSILGTHVWEDRRFGGFAQVEGVDRFWWWDGLHPTHDDETGVTNLWRRAVVEDRALRSLRT